MNKHLLALATGLLLGTTAATAQLHNWDNLPTLEEWPLEPYMRNIFHFESLPNFELPEGKHAVKVDVVLDSTPNNFTAIARTWYLRHPGDSVNQFDWTHPKSAIRIRPIDMNNDGITDYISGTNLYMGTAPGRKPQAEPINLEEQGFFWGNRGVVDVNGDGYPDMVSDERILLGGSMPSMYKRVEVPFDSVRIRNYFNTKIRYFSSWKGSDGVIRYAISYTDSVTKEPVRQSLCIYRMQVTGEVVRMELEHEIESVGFNHLVSGVSPFQPEGTNGREFVFLQRGVKTNRTELYAIENGKWVFKERLSGPVTLLQGSIDQDTIKDLLIFDEATTTLLAYSGKDLPALQPKSIVPLALNHAYIGDVNNDGIGDMGALVDFPTQFQIILGKNTANSVSEPSIQNVHLYPNPADSIIRVRSTIKHPGTYTYMLYRSTGEFITTLGKSENIEGAIETSFDLRTLGIAPGAYILRLTGNGTFTDMQFIYGGN
jgi:hypothetical protein